MTLHLHHLRGCAPAPLAHYLKALGILRVVGRQKDPDARGYWHDEHFCLLTKLDQGALERFLLEEYAPTPFVSPWNRGSGFYAAEDPGLGPLEKSTAPRFEPFRHGIAAGRAPLAAIGAADARVRALKDRTKKKKGMTREQATTAEKLKLDPEFKAELSAAEREFKRLKADLYAPFVSSWRQGHREWLDAAMVLSADGEPSWASLLGTGGNDGRLDFTNNAMRRLGDLFDLSSPSGAPSVAAPRLLAQALWAAVTNDLQSGPVGQFLPGTAGGANGTTGPDSSALVNPWDFVLMLEGATLFRGETTRRLDARGGGRAAVPFAAYAHPVGHGTRGQEKVDRGEQWMPLWRQPTTLDGVEALLCEGRAQVGRSVADRPLDLARAVARLGVARGLSGFVRYGYLERNGQSNIAVPLGRIATGERVHARLVDDLAGWLDQLQRLVRGGDAPSRLAIAEGALADAVFSVLTRDEGPARWQDILVAAARVEALQASGTGFEAGPLPRLSGEWLDAAANDSPEWRLALSLGSAAAAHGRRGTVDPVRAHALPIERGRYAVKEKRLVRSPRVVMTGRDALGDLVAIVERRLTEATQRGERELPLVAWRGAGARLTDLAAFLEGRVDVPRTVWLARALMAVRWRGSPVHPGARQAPQREPDAGWQALRLCGLPFEVAGRRVPIDAAMVRRLAAGDATAAVGLALRRLAGVGLRPPLRSAVVDAATARRWAAALAFPIEPHIAHAMAARFSNLVTTEPA
ncbi:MAG: type I-U CRISPR-associated protein Csx17 [Sandaracinaceae bacterium]|nr:type I-U CRISPR-associated protein Csx17 [Sandaracinaceae bacterium]